MRGLGNQACCKCGALLRTRLSGQTSTIRLLARERHLHWHISTLEHSSYRGKQLIRELGVFMRQWRRLNGFCDFFHLFLVVAAAHELFMLTSLQPPAFQCRLHRLQGPRQQQQWSYQQHSCMLQRLRLLGLHPTCPSKRLKEYACHHRRQSMCRFFLETCSI